MLGTPLAIWSALEGLGWLSPPEGEVYPQAAGPDVSSTQGAEWDTVEGSEQQANIFSPNTVSILVWLHVTSGYNR